MSNTMSRKFLSLVLAVLMLAGTMVIPAYADTATGSADGSGSLTDIGEFTATPTYKQYRDEYKGAEEIKGTYPIDIEGIVEDKSSGNLGISEITDENGVAKKAVLTDDAGRVTFNVSVEKAGFYGLRLQYLPTKPGDTAEAKGVTGDDLAAAKDASESTTNVERTLYVNGEVPYSEARNLIMYKRWEDKYTKVKGEDGKEDYRFKADQAGNELRADKFVSYVWQEYVLVDYNGYYSEPLMIYLEEGENTIAFETIRHAAYIAELELFSKESAKTYDEVMKDYEKKGYKNAKNGYIYIDAETPDAVSTNQIFATSDSVSPATEPQSAEFNYRNIISTGAVGQWLDYEFDVKEAGIYSFMIRFRQNISASPVSRKILIDGEVPYDAAENVKFGFSENWQTAYAASGDKIIKVYLEKGKHTLRMEVNLGEIGEQLRRATAVQTALNEDYLEIIRLTGAVPDEYRDYGFSRVMPDVMEDLFKQGKELYSIVEYLEKEGQLSEATSTLKQIAERVYTMGKDESQVAKNVDGLKGDLGSLSSWVTSMLTQTLEMDYIAVQSCDKEIPKAEGNFISGAWFEIQKFVASFYVDYNALSDPGNDGAKGQPVLVWSTQSRDHTQIIKDQADSKFTTETKIPVTLKLVVGGTLLPSLLAGIGPDIALDGMTSTNTAIASSTGSIIDYAVRGAVLPLQNFDTFGQVASRFTSSAFEPVTLYTPEDPDVLNVYGVPTSLDFSMTFYREDIFSKLGLAEPKTWDDIMASVPVLQFNNMEVGLGHGTTDFATFIFQNGGEFWADNGMRVNFESNTTLESFEYMVNMFTQYSLPLSFDALTRFKTGELPLFIGSYITYNTLMIYAPEIAGLWKFAPMPGMYTGEYDEDGNAIINNTTVGSIDAICMLKGCKDEKRAWQFIDWYTDKDFQVNYSNELILLLGESGMRTVANLEALAELQWKKDDLEALFAQVPSVKCLPQYPGSYIITRYVTFAVNNAYSMGADPVEQLLGYTSAINKEITRKRSEFGFETLEIGQTLAAKRLDEALEKIGKLSDSDAKKYADLIKEFKKANDDIAAVDRAEKLEAAADGLRFANEKLFADIVGDIDEAVECLVKYDK